MFAVIRVFTNMHSIEVAARRAKGGVGPILQKAPGFSGYYVVDGGNGIGASVSLFETQEAATAASAEALSWLRQNIADLYEGEPEVIAGEVLAVVKPARVG